MADNSKIEWTDATFNPWRGCTKVSAGCAHCYADTLSKRNPLTLGVWGPNGTRVVAAESAWREPMKWNRLAGEGKLPDGSPNVHGHRPRVFCASLADVFEDWQGPMSAANGATLLRVSNTSGDRWEAERDTRPMGLARPLTMDDVRRRLFDLIYATPNIDWLLVTKRPENAARMMGPGGVGLYAHANGPVPCPQPNLWLGVSVENQAAADKRIPHLLRVPAAVRFLSCEPLLEAVDLRGTVIDHTRGRVGTSVCNWLTRHVCPSCSRPMVRWTGDTTRDCEYCGSLGYRDAGAPLISWVIVGGESGPGARPMHLSWARSIVAQCKAAGVAVFVKQLGAVPIYVTYEGKPLVPVERPWTDRDPRAGSCVGPERPITRAGFADKKGGDVNQFPTDLRVREFPTPTEA